MTKTLDDIPKIPWSDPYWCSDEEATSKNGNNASERKTKATLTVIKENEESISRGDSSLNSNYKPENKTKIDLNQYYRNKASPTFSDLATIPWDDPYWDSDYEPETESKTDINENFIKEMEIISNKNKTFPEDEPSLYSDYDSECKSKTDLTEDFIKEKETTSKENDSLPWDDPSWNSDYESELESENKSNINVNSFERSISVINEKNKPRERESEGSVNPQNVDNNNNYDNTKLQPMREKNQYSQKSNGLNPEVPDKENLLIPTVDRTEVIQNNNIDQKHETVTITKRPSLPIYDVNAVKGKWSNLFTEKDLEAAKVFPQLKMPVPGIDKSQKPKSMENNENRGAKKCNNNTGYQNSNSNNSHNNSINNNNKSNQYNIDHNNRNYYNDDYKIRNDSLPTGYRKENPETVEGNKNNRRPSMRGSYRNNDRNMFSDNRYK